MLFCSLRGALLLADGVVLPVEGDIALALELPDELLRLLQLVVLGLQLL